MPTPGRRKSFHAATYFEQSGSSAERRRRLAQQPINAATMVPTAATPAPTPAAHIDPGAQWPEAAAGVDVGITTSGGLQSHEPGTHLQPPADTGTSHL